MMRPYPFFGFPSFRRPYPYYSPYYSSHVPHATVMNYKEKPFSPSTLPKREKANLNGKSTSTDSLQNQLPFMNDAKNFENNSEECFEIFGLKLYFDDLLLIALLFFLYQEEVKDTYLYIALILLLLS